MMLRWQLLVVKIYYSITNNMKSYVVDYKRIGRVEVQEPDKFNINHFCIILVALFCMYIFKRIKDRKSDQPH